MPSGRPPGKNGLADLIAKLELNIFLLADAKGRIVWSRGYDEATESLQTVPRGLLPHLTPNSPLVRQQGSDKALTGLVFIPEGSLLVVSEHILATEGDDAILGAVIMGRYLDDAAVQQLSELTRLSLTVRRLDGGEMPADFREALSSLPQEESVAVQTLGDDLVAGYTVLPDVYDEAGLVVRVDVPRDIMEETCFTCWAPSSLWAWWLWC